MVRSVLNKKLWRDLLEFKAQVASISVVVGIGVGVYFGFSTTYESLLASRDSFYTTSRFADYFARVKKAPNAILGKLAQLDGVESVEGRIEYDALLSLPKMVEPGVAHFVSLPDGKPSELSQIFLLKGKRPSATSDQEVMVSENFFDTHELQLGDHFFSTLNGRKRKFVITGVGVSAEHIIAVPPGSPMPDDEHYVVVWANRKALAPILDLTTAFNSVAFKVQPRVSPEKIKSQIDLVLDSYGGVGSFGRDEQMSAVYVREELKQLRVQAASIPIVFFIVAAFILNIVISRLVQAQRDEIATLKAVGYRNASISAYYFQISAIIVLFGSIIGVAIGLWIGRNMVHLYTHFYNFPLLAYDFSWKQLVISIFIALLTAVVGVFSSLRKVFSLQPAEAMRPPAPVSYQNRWLEKRALFRLLQPESRMAIRGLISHPLRSAMVGFGVSFSIVLLILGLFWGDSLDTLLNGQYSFRQKETGSVQLAQALKTSAVQEVGRLPGVVEAEGYWSVPVKVRFNNREESTAIRGLPENHQLFSLIDENFSPLRLPSTGLHMSHLLAQKLGVTPGSSVEVEILEGRKEKFRLQVKNVMGTFFDQEIFTSRRQLAELMKSDERVTQILFRSVGDPIPLYKKMKEIPQILTVSYKNAAMKVFNETSAKFLLVFAMIFSLFAGAIAYGIAYNNLRVTLAERNWEMATLMILGFKKWEVFRILAAEVFTLVMGFVPLGWVMGYYNARYLLLQLSMEDFPIPFRVDPLSYFISSVVVVVATGISCFFIYRRLKQMDFVATLKSRG